VTRIDAFRNDRKVDQAVLHRRFRDRYEASAHLAARLGGYAHRSDTLILGLPRGGVPVAYGVAHALVAPLDVLTVRKLGMPGHEELALGAAVSGGIPVFNDELISSLRVSEGRLAALLREAERELAVRERLYRGTLQPHPVRDHIVVLVDDGIATGATMRAAVRALRQQAPRWIVVAAPVAAPEAGAMLKQEADEVVSVITPEPFWSVSTWYHDFSSVSDQDVQQLLGRAAREQAPASHLPATQARDAFAPVRSLPRPEGP
jgi:predicted phosphoribosyltransferase